MLKISAIKLTRKKTITVAILVLSVSAASIAAFGFRAHATLACVPVVTSRGSLTTAAVNNVPAILGDIDAHGCQIGDYINVSGTATGLTVHDANQYGIFVDSLAGAITVDISSVTVYNIGNHDGTGAFAPNGVQTGIGIIFDSGDAGPLASGSISSSTVYAYQKGGIEVNRNSNVATTGNTVTGLGHVDYIAQNGIEYARDASGTIQQNTVSGNFYSGKTGLLANGSPCGGSNPSCPPGRQYVSCGILLVLIDPNTINRGQNDLNAPPPNDNQRQFAVVTDAALD
jgi:hypothetical protein